ncbi:hypothetical protein [Mesorhizobium sp. M0478]|uniref:hypothetical protein n=1 Tax=Mesorhizobium sp. M0478 TaxID=2956947 RepID=UPI00333A4C69
MTAGEASPLIHFAMCAFWVLWGQDGEVKTQEGSSASSTRSSGDKLDENSEGTEIQDGRPA